MNAAVQLDLGGEWPALKRVWVDAREVAKGCVCKGKQWCDMCAPMVHDIALGPCPECAIPDMFARRTHVHDTPDAGTFRAPGWGDVSFKRSMGT